VSWPLVLVIASTVCVVTGCVLVIADNGAAVQIELENGEVHTATGKTGSTRPTYNGNPHK